MASKRMLKVTIEGAAKTGKSLIAQIIQDALIARDVVVFVSDIDAPLKRTPEVIDLALKSIAKDVEVHIITKQVNNT
jgi:hypothetical protein